MKKLAIFLALVTLMMPLTACGGPVVYANTTTINKDSVYLTLINKEHPLPSDWLSNIELIVSYGAWGDEVQIERLTLDHFELLRDCLLVEDGIEIELDSVYRSIADQEALWENFKEIYGEEYCIKYVAKPGCSEHHTGLAIDICLIKDGQIINDNDAMLAETEIFSTIHERLAEYGFILRYPDGKKDLTGYDYEPWHFRYVGDVPATEMFEKQLTLEEYLAS